MPAKIRSAAIVGVDATPVDVEADIAPGLPNFTVVGLPDAAIKESRERVRAAIRNSGASFPRTRVSVNLAPADVRKEGPSYDLPMATAILAAEGVVPLSHGPRKLIIGELSLDGRVRPVSGMLSVALMAVRDGYEELLVPAGNAEEAALALAPDTATRILPVTDLPEAIAVLRGERRVEPLVPVTTFEPTARPATTDMADVHGQGRAKRALEIAAAGGHNVLMSGPPGSGKTLLARAMPSILPDMTREELLEVTKVHSVAGLVAGKRGVVAARPFRSPHHSASNAALIGGGTWPRPGEVSLAHRGVLFLDELPEFPRGLLESLRQPLEDGFVTVSRSQCTVRFPARFMLVAARNPCPCGAASGACECMPSAVARYHRKLSGPLMDRIDLHVDVPSVATTELMTTANAEPSAHIRERVTAARQRQAARFAGFGIAVNAEMSVAQLKKHCRLGGDAADLLLKATDKLHLSARAYGRVLKVGRTIADLEGSGAIEARHIAEAVDYRERQ